MQIVYRPNGRDLELDLDLGNPDATLGDVVRAVEGLSVDAVNVDGRSFPASSLVADTGLPNGAHVTSQRVPGRHARVPALHRPLLHELAVVAGPCSGQRFPLGIGRHRIGREPATGSGSTTTPSRASTSSSTSTRPAPPG